MTSSNSTASFYDRLNELIDRKATQGRDSLSTKEQIVDDVADLMFRVTMGGVIGLRDDTTPEQKTRLTLAVQVIALPSLTSLVEESFARAEGAPFHDLDERFGDLHHDVHERLAVFLNEE